MNKKTIILIPSYNCSLKFVNVIKKLRINNIKNDILIIDDNSSDESRKIIDNIKKKFKNILVLKNSLNLGQGGSIKRGIKFINKKYQLICTMDDDGQHHFKDVKKIINMSKKLKLNNQVIFGIRDLSFKKTPFKSFLGNKISSIIYKLITNDRLEDTQTGLRLYNTKLAIKFLKIKANGFDFHNIMNYFLIKNKVKIYKIQIKTIYFDRNKKTRFKGINDTFKILNSISKFYLNLIFPR